MIHKIRLITEGTKTKIFLDDQEISGCIAANINYTPFELPVVKLELREQEIEVKAEQVEVYRSKADEDCL